MLHARTAAFIALCMEPLSMTVFANLADFLVPATEGKMSTLFLWVHQYVCNAR